MNLLIGLLVSIIYILLLLNDFKKGVILISTTIQFLAYLGTGIPGLKIYTLLALFSLIIFFTKRTVKIIKYKSSKNKDESYPKQLLYSSVFMSLCFLVSNHYAYEKQTALVIINIITLLIFPFILWSAISSREYFIFTIKCIVVFMTIAVITSIPELLLRKNYFTTIIQYLFTVEDFIIDAKGIRFGLKRLNSIFAYFSVFGTISCFSFFILFHLKYKYQDSYFSQKKTISVLCAVLPFLAFATGSRAIIVGLFAILASCIFTKNFIRNKIFSRILFYFIVLSPIIIYILVIIIDSIINSDTSKQVVGSSSEMRVLQTEICVPYFLQSPIWGNGRLYIWNVVAPDNPMLLGAESIWFSLLIDYGIMGGISFLFLLISSGIVLYKEKKSFILLPISYFLITLVSPDVGIQYNIYLTFVIIILKCKQFSKCTDITKAYLNPNNNI